jgi:ribonuclease R
MLPPALSNGVCSLNPNEPRAALVCEVWIDKNGRKKKHVFRRALIQSARRLTYDEVQSAMDGDMPIQGLETEISHLVGAYEALKKRRDRRGVLEIDVPEKQVILNDKGHIIDIRLRPQLPSMQLIEEMMILANVAAAETLEDKSAPTMYRVHDKPSLQKVENLSSFLQSIGQSSHLGENPTPADFNTILNQVKGTVREIAVNELVLRSQSQAVYSPENIGHFGLALDRYVHFTSPIRRYADIMVHRALIKALKLGEGALTDEDITTFEETARHISYTERQAASAEQGAVDRYVTAWMSDKVGQAFDARISSITAFGLFLSVEPYGADGFVPMHALTGDFYEYDESAQKLVGRSTGKTYIVGDIVRAVLRECVPVTGSLVFSLVKGGSFEAPKKRSVRPKQKRTFYRRRRKKK